MITKIIDETLIKKLTALVEESDKIVITCHIAPDGDALGSSLGLCHVLESLGKTVKVITPDVPPKHLMFLPGAKEIIAYSKYEEFANKLCEKSDLIFALDYNAIHRVDRLGPAILASKAKKVMIDHHEGPDDFCDLIISYPKVSSTSMLVFRVLTRMALFPLIDKTVGTCLLTGMMTDTGNFAYNCNDPDLYVVESELIKKGVDKVAIYNKVFNETNADELRINAFAIGERMKLYPAQGVAIIYLSRADLNRYNYQKGYTEGLVNQPLRIPQITYSFYLREESDFIKVSSRSKGHFAVNEICSRYFGGGGHINAAGGEFKGTLEEAVAKVKEIFSIAD